MSSLAGERFSFVSQTLESRSDPGSWLCHQPPAAAQTSLCQDRQEVTLGPGTRSLCRINPSL